MVFQRRRDRGGRRWAGPVVLVVVALWGRSAPCVPAPVIAAEAAPWSVAGAAGAAVNTAGEHAWVLTLMVERGLGRWLEAGASFGYGAARLRRSLDLGLRLGVRLVRGRHVAAFGLRAGYTLIVSIEPVPFSHVALAGVYGEYRLRIDELWELRVAPLRFSNIYGDFVISRWEPAAGVGLRF